MREVKNEICKILLHQVNQKRKYIEYKLCTNF